MAEYVKKLLQKWYYFLGIPASFSDYALVLVGVDDIKIPDLVRYALILFTFLYASYTVWADEKKENERLLALQANPVDYEVTGKLYPIDYEIEKLLKIIDDNVIKAQEEIVLANTELLEIRPKTTDFESNSLHISSHLASLIGEAIAVNPNLFNQDQYQKNLKKYVRELSEYIEHHKKYRINLIDKIDALGQRYYVELYIKNTGKKSDSQIDVNITTIRNRFLKNTEGYDYLKYVAMFPKKPEPPKNAFANLNPNFDILKQHDFSHLASINTYRSNVDINNSSISVTIRDMSVGDEAQLVKEKLFVDLTDEADFKIVIKSKESNAVIEKKVLVTMQTESKKIHDILQ